MRVAMLCSAWAERMGLPEDERDRIEVAALLHDVGKIGIPDRILRKPGKLTPDEQHSMDCCPAIGREIIRGSTSDNELLDIVFYAGNWYQGRRDDDSINGKDLPLGSRMIFIVNAFDSMTTDHVYRAAFSRERALGELTNGSGIQFDPDLVADFCRMLEDRPEMLNRGIVDRWLVQLESKGSDSLWDGGYNENGHDQKINLKQRQDDLFYSQLLQNLDDCIAFVDTEGTVTNWNSAMRNLTGISADAIIGQTWNTRAAHLRIPMEEDYCPVRECLTNSMPVSTRMFVDKGNDKESLPYKVQVDVYPVYADTPGHRGAILIIRDPNQLELEDRVESLHKKATCDPLTGVANRSFFDETLGSLVKETSEGGESFSLIICDIDHFKRVNDVHGHPAGDEALVTFASVLASHSRGTDLVARYGGEEFLLLATNCDNATAAKRAEAIRAAIEATPLPSLGGETVTVSFGVTEFQSGDTSETIVARADRALLKAKDNGRNRVVQLGAGKSSEPSVKGNKNGSGLFSWFGGSKNAPAREVEMLSPVTADIVIEKLRGFIADHQAQVLDVQENQLSVRVVAVGMTEGRRSADHRMPLDLNLTLREDTKTTGASHTNILLQIEPTKTRDRRRRELKVCMDQVLFSLRSYVLAEVIDIRNV